LSGFVLASSIAAEMIDASEELQVIGMFSIDRTEVSISQFARFVSAAGMVKKAEREGGGFVCAAGWEQKTGWNWRMAC
jgi:formylglycine-generating enzyme